jgi:hypothetical protein
MITMSATYLAVGAVALGFFCVFLGHVVGFGMRTRHAQLHYPAQSTREQLDRTWVGFFERHPDS